MARLKSASARCCRFWPDRLGRARHRPSALLAVGRDRLVEIGKRAAVVLAAGVGRAAQAPWPRHCPASSLSMASASCRAPLMSPSSRRSSPRTLQQIGVPGEFERAADVGHGALAVAFGGVGFGAQFVASSAGFGRRHRAVVGGERLVDIVFLAPERWLARSRRQTFFGSSLRRFRVIAQRAVDDRRRPSRACAAQHVIVRARRSRR